MEANLQHHDSSMHDEQIPAESPQLEKDPLHEIENSLLRYVNSMTSYIGEINAKSCLHNLPGEVNMSGT